MQLSPLIKSFDGRIAVSGTETLYNPDAALPPLWKETDASLLVFRQASREASQHRATFSNTPWKRAFVLLPVPRPQGVSS
jgi:hypothetical protein